MRHLPLIGSLLALLALGLWLALRPSADEAGIPDRGAALPTIPVLPETPDAFPHTYAHLFGTVRDGESGSPLVGAAVTVVRAEATSPPLASAVTSEPDGAFHFLFDIPPGAVDLHVEHPGYAPGSRRGVVLDRRTTRSVVVRLDPGAVISGRAVYASINGEPVANTRVLVQSSSREPPVRELAPTDLDGLFVADVPAGTYSVTVNVEGWKTAHEVVEARAGELVELELVLLRPLLVTGTVTAGGEPLRGGRVTAFGDPDQRAVGSGAIDEWGLYALEVPRPGHYELQVDLRQDARFEVVVPHGVHEVARDIEMPAGEIVGLVFDRETGEPVADAQVLALDESAWRGATYGEVKAKAMALTDAEGRFALEHMAPGALTLVAQATGYARSRQATVELVGARARQEIEIALDQGRSLAARVAGPDGQPVPEAYAFLRERDGALLPFSSAGISDASGEFTLPGLPAGTYELTLFHEEYAPRSLWVEVGVAAAPVPVELERGCSLLATVVDQEDQPIAGARVEIVSADGADALAAWRLYESALGSAPELESDLDGRLPVAPLPAGAWSVRARLGDLASSEEAVVLAAARPAEVQLVVHR